MTKEYGHFLPLMHTTRLTYENPFPVEIFQGPHMIISLFSISIK